MGLIGTNRDSNSPDVHSANTQANTGLCGPCFVSTHVPLPVQDLGSGGFCRCLRRPLLERMRKAQGEDWAKVRADIDAALADYQRLGCVFNLGKSHHEINAIGMPAFSPDGQRIVALTCGGARSSLTRETLLTRVALALRDLAGRIGPLIATSPRG